MIASKDLSPISTADSCALLLFVFMYDNPITIPNIYSRCIYVQMEMINVEQQFALCADTQVRSCNGRARKRLQSSRFTLGWPFGHRRKLRDGARFFRDKSLAERHKVHLCASSATYPFATSFHARETPAGTVIRSPPHAPARPSRPTEKSRCPPTTNDIMKTIRPLFFLLLCAQLTISAQR